VSDHETRLLLVEQLRAFYGRDWVSGTGGGICGPSEDGNLLVAPTGVHKERVQPEDLFVIAVTLLPFVAVNVVAFRLIRLLRILRLAKLGRLSTALRLLYSVIASRRYELIATLGLASTLLILGASSLYWLEGEVQPDKFGSIPRALWWAVITLTTIGYGDVYPITAAGKVVAAMVAISGIGLIAMPTGILASAFSEAVRKPRG
jgi:voltage-gated potassium channel